MSANTRNYSVTIAKALGIISVVLLHSGMPICVFNYLIMFVMPLFFFLSGYCFKDKYLGEKKTFLCKRIKGLYWPYAKWGIVFVLLHNFFYSVGIYNDTSEFNGHVILPYTTIEFWKKIISVVTMHGTERLLGAFWFLRSLFYASLFFIFVRSVIKNVWLGAVVLFVLAFVSSYFNIRVPYLHIGHVDFFAAYFIMVGHGVKTLKIKSKTIVQYVNNSWPLIIVFALIVGVGSVFWPSSVNCKWNTMLPYSITAILGTLMIFAIADKLNRLTCNASLLCNRIISVIKNLVVYIGEHTLEILTWHFLSFKIVSLIIIYTYRLSWDRLGDFPVMTDYAHQGWWIIYLVVGVALPISSTYAYHSFILNKITPGKLT